MSNTDIVGYLSSIPVGTVVAWMSAIGTILGVIVAGLKKIYKILEISYKVKEESDTLKEMIKRHEAQLTQINNQLSDIKESLDEQDKVEFKRMRHEIVQAGETAILNKSITIRQLRALEELYEVYHGERHGNGYVSTLMEKVRNLPIIGKLDDNDKDIEQ